MSTYQITASSKEIVSSMGKDVHFQHSLLRTAANFALKESGIEEVESVQTAKKVKNYYDASGASAMYQITKRRESERVLNNPTGEASQFYKKMNALGREIGLGNLGDMSLGELQVLFPDNKPPEGVPADKWDDLQLLLQSKSASEVEIDVLIRAVQKSGVSTRDLSVDLSKEDSIEAFFKYIDKYAEKQGLSPLSYMSVRQIRELSKSKGIAEDVSKVLEEAADLKAHLENMRSVQSSFGKMRRGLINEAHKTLKDVDSVDSAFTAYETVDSVRNTIKISKKIAQKIKHASSSPRTRSTTTAKYEAGSKASRTSAKAAASETAKSTASSTASNAGKSIGGSVAEGIGMTVKGSAAGGTGTAGTGAAGATATATAGGGAAAGGSAAAGGGAAVGGWIVVAIAVIVIAVLFVFAYVSSIVSGIMRRLGDDSTTTAENENALEISITEILQNKNNKFFSNGLDIDDINISIAETGYWDYALSSKHIITSPDNVNKVFWDANGNNFGESRVNSMDIMACVLVLEETNASPVPETLKKYASELWDDTHEYSLQSASSVYSCSGCRTITYYCNCSYDWFNNASSGAPQSALVPSTSRGCEAKIVPGIGDGSMIPIIKGDKYNRSRNALPPYHNKAATGTVEYYCPGHTLHYCVGHVDVEVVAKTIFMELDDNLFFNKDTLASGTDLSIVNGETYHWEGWTSDNIELARFLVYGVQAIGRPDPLPDIATALSQEQLNHYKELVGTLSDKQKTLMDLVLSSVGYTQYDPSLSKNFQAIISEAQASHTSGLSPKLNVLYWPYWIYHQNGNSLLEHSQSASLQHLSTVGIATTRTELKPGDILINDVDEIGIFIAWDEDGRMIYAHMDSTAGTVIISHKYEKYWSYYRTIALEN